MKRLYFLIFSFLCVFQAFAQKQNCTQVLRTARLTYEQGRLHELPAQVEGCLNGTGENGFTVDQKREAYRLLTLAYIYLEEPEKADESMLKLMETDHFFQINPALDPAEFIALYKKFRADPVYWVGLKFLANLSQPAIQKYYNIGADGAQNGKYVPKIGIQVFLTFEKSISKKIAAVPEIGYVNRVYGYTNSRLAVADEDPNLSISTQEFAVSQNWLDLNAIFNYKFKDELNIKTYLGGGPGVSYLLNSSNQAQTVLGNGFTVTGGGVNDSDSYNRIVYTFNFVAGAKIKFADFYVMADVRYQMGLVNAVKSSTRTNAELGFDYQGQYNDYRMNNLMINVGVSYPIFKPKKLIK